MGIVRLGSLASSAAMATPSMARKNQIAKGIAAKMPPIAAGPKLSCPAQPPAVKLSRRKAGATTPMKTRSSATASTVTNSSKVAAMRTPTMLRPMNSR